MDPILDEVRTILAGLLRIDPEMIRPNSHVRNLPNVDSLAILETVVAIEDHFGIELPDAVVLKVECVADIVAAVRELRFPEAHAV